MHYGLYSLNEKEKLKALFHFASVFSNQAKALYQFLNVQQTTQTCRQGEADAATKVKIMI